MNKANKPQKKTGVNPWKAVALCMIIVILPWAFYVNFHPRFDAMGHITVDHGAATPATSLGQLSNQINQVASNPLNAGVPAVSVPRVQVTATKKLEFPDLPVLGPIPTSGAKPLFGVEHKGKLEEAFVFVYEP